MKQKIAIIGHIGNSGLSNALASLNDKFDVEIVTNEEAKEKGYVFSNRQEPIPIMPIPEIEYTFEPPLTRAERRKAERKKRHI